MAVYAPMALMRSTVGARSGNVCHRHAERSGQRIFGVPFSGIIVHDIAVVAQILPHPPRPQPRDVFAGSHVPCRRGFSVFSASTVSAGAASSMKKDDLVERFKIIQASLSRWTDSSAATPVDHQGYATSTPMDAKTSSAGWPPWRAPSLLDQDVLQSWTILYLRGTFPPVPVGPSSTTSPWSIASMALREPRGQLAFMGDDRPCGAHAVDGLQQLHDPQTAPGRYCRWARPAMMMGGNAPKPAPAQSRCCSPPESSCGRLCALPASPHPGSAHRARAA